MRASAAAPADAAIDRAMAALRAARALTLVAEVENFGWGGVDAGVPIAFYRLGSDNALTLIGSSPLPMSLLRWHS